MKTVAVCITANGIYKLVCEDGLYRIEKKGGLELLFKRDCSKERALELFSKIPTYKGF